VGTMLLMFMSGLRKKSYLKQGIDAKILKM
jgi:hypothetical protein